MPAARARLSCALSIALLVAAVLPLAAVATGYAPAVTRLAGPDRYATSAAVAATYSAPQPVVYIASGANFPDALSGAPVAGLKGAPLLLVAPTSLPSTARAQLVRLAPSTIVIMGSTGSVSKTVADQLAALPSTPNIVRYGGVDRYDTSAMVVDPTRTAPGQTASYSAPVAGVFIASGADYPDALSVAPLAGSRGWPLLLVRPDRIPDPIRQALASLQPRSITIVGGTGSVSQAVQDQLVRDVLGGNAGALTRIAGVDRYATSAAISTQGFAGLPPAPVAYIATGTGFPDALAGAPLAAKQGVPLLLVRPTSVPAPVGTELKRLKLSSLVVLGGPGSITDGMLLTLSFYLDAGSPSPGCPIFPASNVWNVDVAGLPVASNSATMIAAIGAGAYLHPDFDAVGDGIPYNVVSAATPTSTVSFSYSSESDHVPYPIPASPLIEGGSDRHLLMVDPGRCRLWELFAASRSGGAWHAGSGATWDLTSNALRPAGWTSADAAGLPIFAGLVRYDEVSAGAIKHALRFTAPSTCAGYVYPALHQAGSGSCTSKPPMGLRVRLKASVDISGFAPQARVVLTALKTYGMILADNGSAWYVSGAPDVHWDDDGLHAFHTLHGSDFEVVDTSGLVNGP
jgi:putative cell wall-binding protein